MVKKKMSGMAKLVIIITLFLIITSYNNKKECDNGPNDGLRPTVVFRVNNINYDTTTAIAYVKDFENEDLLMDRYGYYSTEEIHCNSPDVNKRGYFNYCVPSYSAFVMDSTREVGGENILDWAANDPFISLDGEKILIAKQSRKSYDQIGSYEIVTANIYKLNYGNYQNVENTRESIDSSKEYTLNVLNVPELPPEYITYFNNNPKVKQVFDSEFGNYVISYGSNNKINWFIYYIGELESTGTLTPLTYCLDQYDTDRDGVIDKGDGIFDSPGMCLVNSENQKELHKVLAAKVAYSIWLDKHNMLPWKLNDYDTNQISQIVSSERLMNFDEKINVDPEWTYNFNKGLIGSNQIETISNILNDARFGRNGLPGFMHSYVGTPIPNGNSVTYQFMASSASIDSNYNKRIAGGCGQMSLYLRESLTSLNIPAQIRRGYFFAGHTSLFIPNYGILFHGDDIYSGEMVEIPAPDYLMSYSYFNSNILPCVNNPSNVLLDLSPGEISCLTRASEDWMNYINPSYKSEPCTVPDKRNCVAGNGCPGEQVCSTYGSWGGCYTNLQACPDGTCSTNCGGTPGTPCTWEGHTILIGETKCIDSTKVTCTSTGVLNIQTNSDFCSSSSGGTGGTTSSGFGCSFNS